MSTIGDETPSSVLQHADLVETHQDWSPMRRRLLHFLEDHRVEYSLSCIITLNLMLLIIETDAAQVGDPPKWIGICNHVMLIFFSIELLIRLFTFRFNLLKDPWAIVDACVIALDLLCAALSVILSGLPTLSMMRTIRLLRMAKTSKIINLIPQLHIIVLSLVGALQPLFWGGVMLIMLLASWGILAVQLINPLVENIVERGGFRECQRCPRAFSSVWQSSLTFCQQIIAGDSWGQATLPIIEEYPASAVFFACVFVSLSMALMNVILASVVDAVTQARLENVRYMAEKNEKERKDAKHMLKRACSCMDKDESGSLSFEELNCGYDTDVNFRMSLNAMDIMKEDLETVWDILDSDRSGDVSYDEFCEELFKMKSSNEHTMLVFMKSYIADIRKSVTVGMTTLKDELQVLHAVQQQQHVLHAELKALRGDTQCTDEMPTNACDPKDPRKHLLPTLEASASAEQDVGRMAGILVEPRALHGVLAYDPSVEERHLMNILMKESLREVEEKSLRNVEISEGCGEQEVEFTLTRLKSRSTMSLARSNEDLQNSHESSSVSAGAFCSRCFRACACTERSSRSNDALIQGIPPTTPCSDRGLQSI